MSPGMRNLRSSIDDGNAGYAMNEEEVPLVPLRASTSTRSHASTKKTRVTSHLEDNDSEHDNNDDDDGEGWELDDFTSNTSKDNLHEAADYDLTTSSRSGRVRLQDEEKNIDDKEVDDPALAMVKAVVPETDDPSLPNLTFRVFVLGSILCGVGAAISQLFFFKSNAPSFSGFLIILLSYPAGHWMAHILPTRPYQLFGYAFTLNPGPFNVKEHLLIAVLAGSGSGAAYGADIITIQDLYYKQDIGPVGGILLLLSTQLLGFGLSGLVYNLLVRPSKMVWPSCLVPISLFNTLHGTEKDKEKLTQMRLRLFKIAFLAIFAWQFMPSVVAPVLTSFATLCILSPVSTLPTARVLGSGYSGYGMLNFSLDWSVIGSAGGLYTPWFASVNRFCGFFLMIWFIAPLLYFNNFWDALSFDSPIGPQLYNKAFDKFDISAILDPATLTLDLEKWELRKPLLLTPHFAITYGVSFSVLTAAVVTVLLWHYDDILSAFSSRRAAEHSPPDIHVQMMEASYEPVPGSWYAAIGLSMLAAAIYVVSFYPMQLPVWGLLLSLLVALVFLPACGIIAATTGTVIGMCVKLQPADDSDALASGLNVITEFIAGFLLPGRPIANTAFKCYGYMVMAQALALVADLKLGLYCKIKPKAMFICQSYGTALGAIVNYIYVRSVINAKRPYLDGTLEDPTGQWTGRAPRIFYSASVIWGLVGPARFFDGKYQTLYLGFAVGAVLPLIPWYLSKKYPNQKWWPKVSVPLILSGMMSAPETPTNVLISGFLSAWLSQRYALKKYPAWYEKYNFVLSAALDAGTSIQALLLYVLGLGQFVEWWGNSKIDSEHCRIAS